MNLPVSWQLVLFLCAISFRETLEKVAPVENPGSTGQQLGPLELRAAWERIPWCAAPESAEGSRQRPLCASRSRLISALRGAALVQREKDLSAYNWNSFGLRYGRRQVGSAPGRRPGTRDFHPRTDRGSGHAGPGNGRGPGVSVLNQ